MRAGGLQKLALAGLSLALTLGALEGAARLARRRPAEPLANQYTEFDPVLGWRHRPGATGHYGHGDYRINLHGLRDRERDPGPAPGTSRLLVLGDSFAEGFSVAFEDSVSQVLERSLDRPGCRAEVVNGGTVGYSTDQEYLFFTREGVRYEPRVVLLFFYYNDILQNARAALGRAPKPLLAFHGGQVQVLNVPLAEPSRSALAPGGAAPHGSAALAWVQDRLREGAPRTYDRLARLGLWPPLDPERPSEDLGVYARHPPRAIVDAWAQTVNILRALQRETAARQTRLLVVYVPSKMEVNESTWALTRTRYGVDDTTWDLKRVARLLAEAGHEGSFPVLDLTEPLQRQNHAVGGPYHTQGGHWNRLGHAVAAAEVEAFLQREGWVPCPPGAR